MSDMKNKSCATSIPAAASCKKSSNGKFRISFNQDYTYVHFVEFTYMCSYIQFKSIQCNVYREKNGSEMMNSLLYYYREEYFFLH